MLTTEQLTQHVMWLREALTDALVTMGDIRRYALMDERDKRNLILTIEHAESVLQLSDDI